MKKARREKYVTLKKGKPSEVSEIRNQYAVIMSQVGVDDVAWKHVKHEPNSLVLWRVNKKNLEIVPDNMVGKFFDGDSYLVLHVYADEKSSTDLKYDIYMWIGKYSTQDEYTTVAFKSSELDNKILKGRGTQHREVQGNESDKFVSIFETFEIVKGGYEAYKRVDKERPKPSPKLFHVCNVKKCVKITEVSFRFENLTSDDVFIIDLYDTIFQFNGSKSDHIERLCAAQFIKNIKTGRKTCEVEIIEEKYLGLNHSALNSLPRKQKMTMKRRRRGNNTKLYKLSDESGNLKFTLVSNAKLNKSSLKTEDVFIFENGKTCYVWIGNNTSKDEKESAMLYGSYYLANISSDPLLPMESVREGSEPEAFWKTFK